MKSSIKKLFTEEQWQALARGRVSVWSRLHIPELQMALGAGLARLIALLPLRSQIVLKERLKPIGRMDYQDRDVRMHVDSVMQYYRLRSCAKEPETVRWIECYIKPGDVLYDIGANIGAYSFAACSHCAGQITVHAFEPSFSNYYYLCQNVILNGCQQSITPHMMALAKESGVSVFNYQSTEAGTALHTLGARVDYKGEAFEPVHVQRVISYSIDDLVSAYGFPVPSHIKLDVDGIELDILHGAAKTLLDSRVRSIQVEMCDYRETESTFTEFLGDKGFRLASRVEHEGRVVNCVYERGEVGR